VISEVKLREIEYRCEKASKGTWHIVVVGDVGDRRSVVAIGTAKGWTHRDIADDDSLFIAASRTDIPALTKALREATAVMRIVSNSHRVSCVCEACEWLREWRGESEKQRSREDEPAPYDWEGQPEL